MSKGIFDNVSKVSGLETVEAVEWRGVSDERPTVADLVPPGAGHKFSDEFACLLRMLSEERNSA